MNGEGCHQSQSISEHLSLAKDAVASGMPSWRVATEHMAAAKAKGASQRRIAEEVGMSSAWVHQMLKWCSDGYKDATPFGPQSKANRQRANAGQATDQKQKADQSDTGTDRAQAAAARARAKAAKAEAAQARADAAKATAEARQAKAEALKAQAEAARAEAEARSARARSNNPNKPKVHSGPRDILVKALGMLGSDQVGERAAAALIVERDRKKLGMTWDELIIPADEAESRQRNSADRHTAN
jgi:multidrug efflux pump subunit AcrA (membrane-fusion protein)